MTGWNDLKVYSAPFADGDSYEDPFRDEPAGAQQGGLEAGGAFEDPFSDEPGDGGARAEAPERPVFWPHSASGAGEDLQDVRDAPEPSFEVSFFRSVTDTRPRPESLPWSELRERLTRHLRVRDKREAPCFSPVRYRPGASRGSDGVEAVTLAVLDFDHDCDTERLRAFLERERLACVLYSTFNHTPDAPRLRAVVPLSRPVPAERWRDTACRLHAFFAQSGCIPDPACTDPGRLFFLPSAPPGAPVLAEARDGRHLDPEELEPVEVVDADAGSRPGDGYNARGDVLSLLESYGWTVHERRGPGGTVYLTRPGKAPREGISATFDRDGRRTLYVFSSNAPPFEANRGYTPFTVYALLEHGGDFAAAARALAAEGYGEPADGNAPARGGWGGPVTGGRAGNPPRPAQQPPKEPVLAEAAYCGLAGEIVRTIEPHTEADPVAILAQLLVAFGNIIGRRPHFRVEADYHALNLFTVLVGTTAKARKGTSWRYVRELFFRLDEDWAKNRVTHGLSSGEGLIWAVRDPAEKTKGRRTEDGSLETETVIEDAGEQDKRLLCVESEFASVLKNTLRDGNTLSVVCRLAWETGDLETKTKNSPARATGAHISIIGHITREELLRYLTETEQADGFANRFIFLHVKRSKVLPWGGCLEEEDMRALAARLRQAVAFARQQDEVGMDEDARRGWEAVYWPLSDGRPGIVGMLTARGEAQVRRLACVYALMDCSPVVRFEHLKAALALWGYAEESVRYIFGTTSGDLAADRILEALRSFPQGLTRTEIRDLFGRHRKAGDVDRALDFLRSTGRAVCVTEDTGGRPGERWMIAPEPDREGGE